MKVSANAVLCALLVACLAIRSVECQCQGATDESSLQAQLASPTSGSLITICSNINLTETLVIRAPLTVQGNCSSRCKISAALPRTVNQLISVAPGTGPVLFRNLQLDGGLAESGETGTLLTGGAVLLSPSSATTFTNVLFTNNAADEGGAVYSSSANATFVGCTFTSNTATASGGAFQAAGGSVAILSSTFQQNIAPLGGAVYLQQTAVPAVVRGSLFVGNQATTQQGGAIFVSVRAVNASIGGNTFAGNTATVSGGAIHDDGASQNGAVVSTAFTVLSGNAFSQNTAPRGGAVSSNVAQTSFCNAQLFLNNVAPTGSNLFATGSEDSGDTKFCPNAPSDFTSGPFAADVGGVFASDCSYCNCGPNNPCDPNAVCTPGSRSGSGTNLTCACRSGFSGNGYVCLGASNSSLLVGNTGASTSPAALASFAPSNSSAPSLGAAPSRAPAPAPVAAPAPSLVNATLANNTAATAPSANATAPNGSLPNATGLNGTAPTATVRNGTITNGSSPANRTAPVPAPGPIAAFAPGGAVIITNSSAPAPTNATGLAPAAGPSGNGSTVVIPLPINATANGTVPAPAPSLNGTVPIPTNATVNVSSPASAPLSAPPPRGTNASSPPPLQPNETTSPPPLQPNATTFPPPPAFPPPAPVATNATATPPIVPNVTLAPPPPLPAATNATAPPPLEPNVTVAPPPPLPEATNATSPPPDSPPPASPPPASPPPNLPPPSLPPPGAPPPPQPTVPVTVTPNQGSPPPVSVPPPPAASPSPPAPTGGLLGGPAAPPPAVCPCPLGQAPGIGATATACNCNYPLTASYRLVDRNLQDWTPTFATSFTSDVAGVLGVQPSQILYTNVQQGSILLDTNVVPLSGATLDNATATRVSGVLQQGRPLNLSASQYGQVLVTSVGLPAQLTSDPPFPSTGVTTPSGPTPSTSPGTTTTSLGGVGSNIGAIIGGVVGGVVFIAVVLAVLVALVKRKRRKQSLPPAGPPVSGARPPKSLERPLSVREKAAGGRESGQLPTPGREDIADKALFGTFRRFGFTEVQQATDDFPQANLLGEGGFGMVYKGTFGDGTMLAVKLLKNTQQGQAESEFLSELGTLGRVRHRNLVALKGFCVSSEDCFLILDYAAGGNLDQALRDPTRPVLTWPQRMNIAVGAARGLSYLHNDCRPTIIHRDIKSANILLDADGEAEVADFGLSKLLDSGQTHQSTRVRGTYGYVAPEYAMYGQVTKKTDVYSFGVVLLELITGLKALDVSQSGERRTLREWVLKRHQQPLTIIDPRLEGEYFREQAEKFISLALACINPSPERRPAMLDILRTLETLNPSGSVPASPLGSPERSGEMQDVYPSTSSDWSAGTGSGTRRTPLRPSSGGSGSSPVGTTFDWSQGHNSKILHNTTQYNMTGINEGR